MDKWKTLAGGFLKDEEGIGTLELLLILAVLVIIAIAFRKWIMKWVGDLFNKANNEITKTDIESDVDQLLSPSPTP